MTPEQIARIEQLEKWLPDQLKKIGEGAGWSLYKNETTTANLVDSDYEISDVSDSVEALVDYLSIEIDYARKFIIVVRTAKNSKNGKPFTIKGASKQVGAQLAGTNRLVSAGGENPYFMEKLKDLEVQIVKKEQEEIFTKKLKKKKKKTKAVEA
ncbi:MAG: hypothetical protein AAGJ18_21575, partial [Bacteroidota bacterium]